MATDGRFVFTKVVPKGDVSFGAVADGQLITRPWTCAANADPQLVSFLDSEGIDPETMARYFDATLYIDGQLCAHITEYDAVMNQEDGEFRPGGQALKWTGMYMGHSWTITFTETLVQDSLLFQKVVTRRLARQPINLTLQFVYKARALASA